MKQDEMKVFKEGTCPSLSQKSTLTYEVGCGNDRAVHIRITGNTGKGIINRGWIMLADLEPLLKNGEPVTAKAMRSILQGRSSNTVGFLTAVLLAERLLKVSPEDPHGYLPVDPVDYRKVQALMDTPQSAEDKPVKAKKTNAHKTEGDE
jgi:hypothetical protein